MYLGVVVYWTYVGIVVYKRKEFFIDMEVAFILKIVGVGILVSLASAILNKSGRDEQAMLVTLAGIVVVMLMLVGEIGDLVESVRSVFGL